MAGWKEKEPETSCYSEEMKDNLERFRICVGRSSKIQAAIIWKGRDAILSCIGVMLFPFNPWEP